MSQATGATQVGNSINSWVDTSNDNIYQALLANQQGKQYWDQAGRDDRRLGMEEQKWAIQKLLEQMALNDEMAKRERNRRFIAAMRKGTLPRSGGNVNPAMGGGATIPSGVIGQ